MTLKSKILCNMIRNLPIMCAFGAMEAMEATAVCLLYVKTTASKYRTEAQEEMEAMYTSGQQLDFQACLNFAERTLRAIMASLAVARGKMATMEKTYNTVCR